MGGYSSREFSRMFSERTISNYEFIRSTVNNKDKYHTADSELFEVTQLLNSLMGLAVLPYEMHKDFFSRILQTDIAGFIRLSNSLEYKLLTKYIMNLYRDNKWKTSYDSDLRDDGSIDEKKIAIRFLRHIRNAVCHSGNNAISILPLSEGTVIDRVVFYDRIPEKYNFHVRDRNGLQGIERPQPKFAMCLSIEELEKLVYKIADLYNNTEIGSINKTRAIKNAEREVEDFLGIKL